MEWYYSEAGHRVGPISEAELESRVARGIVTPLTLVWHDGAEGWRPLREAKPGLNREEARGQTTPRGRNCGSCGKPFPAEELIQIHAQWVCAGCKPMFLQRLKEGVQAVGSHNYGGFWVRFWAKFIDGLVLGAVQLALLAPMFVLTWSGADAETLFGWNLVGSVVQYPIAIGYTVFFLGRYAATPGKIALGLKVIRPEGERLTYLRALGRYGAELISAMILLIGYIMAAFDDEKRALHDRICDTRVIRTR